MQHKAVYWFYFHTKDGELELIVSPVKLTYVEACVLVSALHTAGFKDAWMEENA